jgi:hypothetical protein
MLVEDIREEHGFLPGDDLKFDTRSRPKYVTATQHKEAKRDVLSGCAELGVRFVACMVLHEIASGRNMAELVGWGANTVIGTFSRFLGHEDDNGIVVVDRLPFPGDFKYLKEKFQVGLKLPGYGARRLDTRIHLFTTTSHGTSHATSAIDIVLGAFRYCVNERERDIAPRSIFPLVANMMWHRRVGGTTYVRDYGLLLRPRHVVVPHYQREYDELTEHLETLLSPVSGEEAASQPRLPYLRRLAGLGQFYCSRTAICPRRGIPVPTRASL